MTLNHVIGAWDLGTWLISFDCSWLVSASHDQLVNEGRKNWESPGKDTDVIHYTCMRRILLF